MFQLSGQTQWELHVRCFDEPFPEEIRKMFSKNSNKDLDGNWPGQSTKNAVGMQVNRGVTGFVLFIQAVRHSVKH